MVILKQFTVLEHIFAYRINQNISKLLHLGSWKTLNWRIHSALVFCVMYNLLQRRFIVPGAWLVSGLPTSCCVTVTELGPGSIVLLSSDRLVALLRVLYLCSVTGALLLEGDWLKAKGFNINCSFSDFIFKHAQLLRQFLRHLFSIRELKFLWFLSRIVYKQNLSKYLKQ